MCTNGVQGGAGCWSEGDLWATCLPKEKEGCRGFTRSRAVSVVSVVVAEWGMGELSELSGAGPWCHGSCILLASHVSFPSLPSASH
jgi:hypothetical protein